MPTGGGARRRAAAIVLVLAVGCTGPGPPPPRTVATVAPLEIRLAKVTAVTLKGRAGRGSLMEPAEAVRGTITALYSAAFLDPTQWQTRFRGVLDAFAPDARPQAKRDLGKLTLGRDARDLHTVHPDQARLVIHFLRDDRGRPVAAQADVRFAAVGYGQNLELPIRHRGTYDLRLERNRWVITGYDVRGEVGPATYRPGVSGRDPLFILAIGSDARPRRPVEGALADSLHIIGLDPTRSAATILGIPRDSYVPIPGGGSQKINAALFRGGPELVVQTVERLAGLRLDGYLLTGFEDFRRMVSEIGGVEITIPEAMSDPYSGARFRAGKTRLDGPEALAFSRNRHGVRGGDIGRSLNQGRLLMAALRELRDDVRRDPLTLFRWLLVGAKYLRTDLGFLDMLDLLTAALTVEKVKNRVVTGGGGFVGGASVIHLGASARAMFRDLARDGML